MKDPQIHIRIEKDSLRRKTVRNNEFIEFVGNQFRQLTRRNLGLPMKLYTL